MSTSYNENLFNGKSLRSKFHFARFNWLNKKINSQSPNYKSMLELGCYDGKLIDLLNLKPAYYEGYDANWNKGLDIAIKKYQNHSDYNFYESTTLKSFAPKKNNFDITISMETIEHLPTAELESYIKKLAQLTENKCYISVPNEKGVLFLAKYFIKRLTKKTINKNSLYSWKELYYATTGNLKKVKRVEGGHKGFDYDELTTLLKKYFTLEKTEGIPFNTLPVWANFTVGIILSKNESSST